jgi:hypothetical protein
MTVIPPSAGPGACWIWTGGFMTKKRYGKITLDAADGFRTELAHRVSYAIHKGPIPKGAYICHTCDREWCQNPEHLYAGSALTNAQDAVARGRRGVLRARRLAQARRDLTR